MIDARRPTRELSDRERIDWLRLARTPSIGPMTFRHLMGRYESPARAIAALPDLGRRGGRSQAVEMPSAADMAAELRAGEALGARLITSVEPGYPRLLAVLDPPPPLLWVLGDVGQLNRPAVAVVGARVASAAGQRFARDLAAALGEAGYAVVSGMARGIDAAAHQGAMNSGSVAVLAGGIDDIYPPEHHELYEQLRARGCLVSEQPVGYRAKAKDFPRRNRIISGLALGVVVVEAELRSGSLITARLAGEQGRDVFAVPGSPMDPRSRGANDLIRQGATLVEEVEDVLRVLTTAPAIAEPEPPSWPVEETDGPTVEARATLLGLLSPTPTPIDDLVRRSGIAAPIVMAALVELSVAGRAEMLGGGLVSGA